MKQNKGGPGSGRKPEGGGAKPSSGIRPSTYKPGQRQIEYVETPASSNPGKPRSGVSPRDLFPHGRNPDGTPRTANDPKPAPRKR